MDELVQKLNDPSVFAALYSEAVQAAARIKKTDAELATLRATADDLYKALVQMKARRGVDVYDVDLVYNAIENYEKVFRHES